MANPTITNSPTSPTYTATFVSLSRASNESAQQTQDISRPGVDGMTSRKIGTRGVTHARVGYSDHESTANYTSHITACFNLQGEIVTITESDGTTTSEVLVQEVRLLDRRTVGLAAGGIYGTLGVMTSQVQFQLKSTVA